MKFRYRGVLYEYHLSHTEAVSPSVLHYQGVFYSREIQSCDYLLEISPVKLTASAYLNYKIYRHSWHKNHHQNLWRFQYWLLLLSLYTRRACYSSQPLLNGKKRTEY